MIPMDELNFQVIYDEGFTHIEVFVGNDGTVLSLDEDVIEEMLYCIREALEEHLATEDDTEGEG